MNIQIGTIIKKLRAENNVTQDSLANAMGVTPQAVSRWELGGGYPDIELLPALADFFSVSIDVLLGYKLSEREKELANIKKELSRLAEDGSEEERIAYARAALTRFPADCDLKMSLAVALYHSWCDTRKGALVTEIESLCTYCFKESEDEELRYQAIEMLIILYGETGQSNKAQSVADRLSPMKYCREFARTHGLGDGKTEFYLQDTIDSLADCLGMTITDYVLNSDLPNDPSTWDHKIEMLEISNSLYTLIYGEDLLYYHTRLSRNHWLISTYKMAQGKEDEALCALEEMCRHAVAYDLCHANGQGKNYSSILTNTLSIPENGDEREHTDCYYMLDRLHSTRYDAIRENARFKEVCNTLKNYAK